MAATWTTRLESCSDNVSADNPHKSLFNDFSVHYRDFSGFLVACFKIFLPIPFVFLAITATMVMNIIILSFSGVSKHFTAFYLLFSRFLILLPIQSWNI
jgi:hypothetical protein